VNESHWWPIGAVKFTKCGELVTDATLYSPTPTCRECCDWIVLEAKILAELDAWDREPDDALLED
jgi:hypothetical protein